jgi:LacI family transcriptional regulator
MRASLAAHGLSLPAERIQFGPWSEAWGAAAIGELLHADAGLDAVVCGSDQIARGVVGALHERGIRVPDQIAVAGFDNWDVMAEATRPPLTTVDLGLHEIGRAAGQHLLAMIDGQPRTGIVRTPCRLVIRESCGSQLTESERRESKPVTEHYP